MSIHHQDEVGVPPALTVPVDMPLSAAQFLYPLDQQQLFQNGTYTRPGERPTDPHTARQRDRRTKDHEESRPIGARIIEYLRETYLSEVYGDMLSTQRRTARNPVWPPVSTEGQSADRYRPLTKAIADQKLDELVARYGKWYSEDKSLAEVAEYTDELVDVLNTVRQHAEYEKYYAKVPPRPVEGTGTVYFNIRDAAMEVNGVMLINRTQVAILEQNFADALSLIMVAHDIAKKRLKHPPLSARCWYWTGVIADKLGEEKLAASAFLKAQPCCGRYMEGEQLSIWVQKYKEQMVAALVDSTTFGRPAHEWADLLVRAASNGEPIFMQSPVQLSPESAQKMHLDIHGGVASPVAPRPPPPRVYRRPRVPHTLLGTKDSSSSWPRQWSPIRGENSPSLRPEEARAEVDRWFNSAELVAKTVDRPTTPIRDSEIVMSSDNSASQYMMSGAVNPLAFRPSAMPAPLKPLPSPTTPPKASWPRIKSLQWKGKPASSGTSSGFDSVPLFALPTDSHLHSEPSSPGQLPGSKNGSIGKIVKDLGLTALLTARAASVAELPMSPTTPTTPSPLRASFTIDEGGKDVG